MTKHKTKTFHFWTTEQVRMQPREAGFVRLPSGSFYTPTTTYVEGVEGAFLPEPPPERFSDEDVRTMRNKVITSAINHGCGERERGWLEAVLDAAIDAVEARERDGKIDGPDGDLIRAVRQGRPSRVEEVYGKQKQR